VQFIFCLNYYQFRRQQLRTCGRSTKPFALPAVVYFYTGFNRGSAFNAGDLNDTGFSLEGTFNGGALSGR
jgi:hypothetical protein